MNQGIDQDTNIDLTAPANNRQRVWLWLILAAYLVITLAYGVINPIFESPDEHMHFFTMQYMADNRQLAAVAPGDEYDEWMGQEAAQPPLYYLLGSALIALLNPDNPSEELWLNEFTTMGDASSLNNINRFVHETSESFPWHDYGLAMHLLRVFSTLLGLGTLLFIYGSSRLLWPGDPYRALLATSLVAFLPQFNFLHSSVTNDVLIILLISAALWQIIRLWLDRVTIGRLVLLGVTTGLAALSKNAGIILLIYAVGVLILLAIREQQSQDDSCLAAHPEPDPTGLAGMRLILSVLVFVVIPAILLAGWLWVRSFQLYGDFTATNQFIRIAGGARDYTIMQVLSESSGLWLSLFAVFGWFNLRPPDWVYWFWNIVVILAIAGALWHGLHQIRARERDSIAPENQRTFHEGVVFLLRQNWVLPILLAGWVVLIYASLVMFMLQTEAAQGRLLFPALLPLALGVTFGLTVVNPIRRISLILSPIALLITLYCLFFVIRPAYARPASILLLPEDVTRLDAQLGQGLTLDGAEIETKTATAGDMIWMTLYWQIQSKIDEPPEFAVSIFGRDLVEVGKHHSYHGRGMFPANLWEPGEIIVDRFPIQLDEAFEVPTLGRIRVSVVDGNQDVQAGEVKIIPTTWPKSEAPELAKIGDAIALISAELNSTAAKPGDTVQVGVKWRVLQPPNADLTTLVHIGPPDQAPLAVGDRPPINGDYPTRVWETGEVINDSYSVMLPAELEAGKYPVWVGLYDSETIARWPLVIDGEGQPHNVYLAGWVEVEE